MALNGGHDALVLLAGEERTAASCSAAQRGSFCYRGVYAHQVNGGDDGVV
jgi:hypothetical protein